MTETYLVAIDLGKRHFQVCATDETGKTLFNRAFSRQKLQEFLDKLPEDRKRCSGPTFQRKQGGASLPDRMDGRSVCVCARPYACL